MNDPQPTLAAYMTKKAYSNKELQPHVGSSGATSEVLSGKRKLNKGSILRIHKAWGIPLLELLEENA